MIAVGPAVYSGIPRTTSEGDGQISSDTRQTNKDKIYRSRVIYNQLSRQAKKQQTRFKGLSHVVMDMYVLMGKYTPTNYGTENATHRPGLFVIL